MIQGNQRYKPITGILMGGTIAGVLDIIYAFIKTDLPPTTILQSVASGVLGSSAFQAAAASAAFGLFCHLAISIGAAAIFFLASKRFSFLIRRSLIAGTVFGILVYLVMNFIVVPLSAAPFTIEHTPMTFVYGFVSHAVLFGIPIAYCIRRYASKR